MKSVIIRTVEVLGYVIDVVGCFEEPETTYDFYDLYELEKIPGKEVYRQSHCINEGEPFYEEPSKEDIKEFLEIQIEEGLLTPKSKA